MSELKRIELSGSPAAMGEAHGEACRDDIRALTETRIAHLVAFVAKYDPDRSPTRDDALAMAAATASAHESYDADIWAEFAGIARGAGLTIEELLIGNGFTDLRDFALFAGDEHLDECSALLAGPGRTGGCPIAGQTWDMNTDARPFVRFVHRRPDRGPETLGVTTTGCLCLIGMNSEGVAVGNTNLVPTDARVGVNYLFTITRALKSRSAAEAADAIEATPRMSGHNFYAVDAVRAINLETTATRCIRTDVTDDVFVHTNHYLCDELLPLEFKPHPRENSLFRCDRLARNVADASGPVMVDDCWRALSDGTRGAGAICNEDYDGQFSPFATLATIVMCPGRGELHACEGGARRGTREVYRL